jgi:hypothetical protein
MFRKDNFISLGLSGIDFLTSSFTESERIITRAIGNSFPIEMRLAETIKWCLAIANPLSPKDSLRSGNLQPEYVNNDIDFICSPHWRVYNTAFLLDTRRKLLGHKMSPVGSYEDLKGGRLLAYFPDETVWDGASEVASMEFFDVLDIPAWDTWVGLFTEKGRDFIVSYIPESFIKFAQDGIDINCVSCIEWLEDTKTNLAKELLDKGIIR